MVYLAITRQGLFEAIDLAMVNGASVWCGADAISNEEFEKLEVRNVTRFIYPLMDADDSVIADALSTVEEHHPGERIWTERPCCSNTSLDSGATRRSA
jgi:hypothetical protein